VNLLKAWQRQVRLNRLQNLRAWLEQVNLHDLYGNGLGKVGEVSCQYYQDESARSKVALFADERRLIEITCFHGEGQYRIETLVRIIDLDDNAVSVENYVMLVLLLLDEINGTYPEGYLVNRMEGALGEIHLCWNCPLPLTVLQTQENFLEFLRRQLGSFLFETLVPTIEEEFTEFAAILRRVSEFHLEGEEQEE